MVEVGKATFVTLEKGKLIIADLSASTVIKGQYPIKVTLDNATETKSYEIILAITSIQTSLLNGGNNVVDSDDELNNEKI